MGVNATLRAVISVPSLSRGWRDSNEEDYVKVVSDDNPGTKLDF